MEEKTNLKPFCPTRWTVRFTSLNSILKNYKRLITFFENLSEESTEAATKAKGFVKSMKSFNFFFSIFILRKMFSHVDASNSAIQKKQFHFGNVKALIENLSETISNLRNQFTVVWAEIEEDRLAKDIEPPKQNRKRKIPKKIDNSYNAVKECFENSEEKCRSLYYEIIDNIVNCLKDRFDTKVYTFLGQAESFLFGDDEFQKEILEFFGSDIDEERLVLHRNMFLDILRAKKLLPQTSSNSKYSMKNFGDFLLLLKSENHILDLLPELMKFTKLILTLPVTTCTAERSFSTLRRLLTYMRSTMTQARLNSLSILHVHSEVAMNVDLNEIANEFIERCEMRRKIFALS